jgi:SAM-dependent methyltransferase
VLDFGCGSGRFLRHLLETGAGGVFEAGAGATFEACDIDPACVDWLARHLPAPHAAFRNAAVPPLDRPAGHYGLIYATSVFSHLTDTWADWLCELHRLLEDGGVLVATVIDEGGGSHFGEDPWDDARIGMLVLGPGRPWAAGGPMVLHSEWWIRAHWGRAFDVLAFHPGRDTVFGQAVVVLRRRRAEVTPEMLLALEPGEPREVSALSHALRRSAEENVLLNARHDEYSGAYQEEAARREAVELERTALAAQLAAVRAELAAARRARGAAMTVLRALAGRARMLARRTRA